MAFAIVMKSKPKRKPQHKEQLKASSSRNIEKRHNDEFTSWIK
ncbi:hypothetical protein CCACVL1_09443 [Corchorus capsularis]|uniref:Uncharacterized protein n=1 Tax=Corchorus capsularis TaxID=210143 RepID=A0A1R3IW91_COCAP|nr:hypothetical protein CCACVL1_09443 [Corchorus capsularis]